MSIKSTKKNLGADVETVRQNFRKFKISKKTNFRYRGIFYICKLMYSQYKMYKPDDVILTYALEMFPVEVKRRAVTICVFAAKRLNGMCHISRAAKEYANSLLRIKGKDVLDDFLEIWASPIPENGCENFPF